MHAPAAPTLDGVGRYRARSGAALLRRCLAAIPLVVGWLVAAPGWATAADAVPDWRLPLDGVPVVTRPFDPPDTPYGRGHRGVDLGGEPGAVVRAAGAGTVGYAGMLAGRGVVTVIHAGGLRTTYEPVEVSVRAGQPVGAGDPLGVLAAGHAGCPAAACLHWGLLRGEVYLDPMLLLARGPLRLLPLTGAVDAGPSRAGAARGGPAASPPEGWPAEGPQGWAASAAVRVPVGAAVGLAVGALLLVRRAP